MHNINNHTTISLHPQSQGEIERFHSTLSEHYCLIIARSKTDFMPLVIMSYNNSINPITKRKPVELFFGNYKPIDRVNNDIITD